MLTGAGVNVVTLPDDAVVLRPPPPRDELEDVRTAVREALQFPLEGAPLQELVRGARRVAIVIELPNLPIPGAPSDPRQRALEAVSDELADAGIGTADQTLVVATGLARRPTARERPLLVSPEFARRFRGQLIVHDVEAPDLVDVGSAGVVPLQVNRAIAETDAVVVVTAAESVVDGGAAALLAAGGAHALRVANAWSLLQPAASFGWRLALELERAVAARAAVFGVSVVLNHPRLLATTLRDFPFEQDAVDAVVRSPLRRAVSLLPRPLRARAIGSLRRELTAASAFAGPPSVAHAEALLRAIDSRQTALAEPVESMVIGVPPTTPTIPREQPNPLSATYLGLGLALRLWRDRFPIVEGGTAILLHPLQRRFAQPTQAPYRTFFQLLRYAREPEPLRAAERAAAADARAIAAYRDGQTVHPLLPFAEWAACGPALTRLGAVLVAGCRDHDAARLLGLVPVHSVNAALEMARARSASGGRVGAVVSPPYFPLRVGG